MAELPWTDSATIEECEKIVDKLQRAAGGANTEELQSARFQLAWALAHSKIPADVDLAIKTLEDPRASSDFPRNREYYYTLAVAQYRSHQYINCRASATKALELAPSCHQSAVLRDAALEAIARDGMIGLGVIGGIGVAVLGGIMASMSRKR
mmetsp:Transcript_29658/g.64741  ORF Transcript_29658/g.64741 Transcript_29658/m.64741 type:complete len:152 (-) Transcript_29658:323-778(-)|eukprot:CAMPEP_0118923004 /NCGR_PEP_ID=MMETSP1169-20130426/1703_1 /TAXON_ID=36882 /ORGANISM="Pyramimonas obovata, Strain CCMP722" /LENGTH=151 /DNA_ID=CAMNT_0006863935 /DNA_START=274 /DNA_END=729 /DNA_ORIENTATION=+